MSDPAYETELAAAIGTATASGVPSMTYDGAFTRLMTEFELPDLAARNVLLTALKGQSAWFGAPRSPYRLVHDSGVTREDGYYVLADGYVPSLPGFGEEA